MRLYLAAATAAFSCALAVQASAASLPCMKRAALVEQLAGKYHEATAGVGLGSNGALFELLTSADGRTWTLVMDLPNGNSCLIAAGDDWQARNEPQPRDEGDGL